jgi:HK97 family phage major capsid protein
MSGRMKLGPQYRTLNIQKESQRTAEDGSPIIRIAISSEFPVTREFGVEILDHTPDALDMSRITNAAPFCVDHNLGDQVGVLENVSLGPDKILRADVRFSRSQRGQDIQNDILDGIRKHISVGYQIRKMQKINRKNEELDTYRVVNWMPFEASVVGIPADPTVGVGRSVSESDLQDVEIIEAEAERGLEITTEVISVNKSTETVTLDDAGNLVSDEYVTANQTNVLTTYTTTPPGEVDEPEDIAEEATETPEDEAAEEALEAAGKPERAETTPVVDTRNEESTTPRPTISIKEGADAQNISELTRMDHINTNEVVLNAKEQREYSLANAIESIAKGQRSGFAIEVSDQIAKNMGLAGGDNSFYMPTNIRTMTSNTATAGQEIVFTAAGQFVDLLRAKTVVLNAGATVIGVNQKVSYPRQASGSSAQWTAEGSAATAQDLVFDSVTIDPKPLTAQASYSRKLGQIASFDVDALIRNSFVKDFAVALDAAALSGSGNAPSGILNTGGVYAVAATSGSLPTFAMLVDAETGVTQNNGDLNGAVYVITPGLAGKLKTTQVASGTDSRMIYAGGEINGYPVYVSNNMPWSTTLSHSALFGNFSNVVVADGGAIEIIVDKLSGALSQQIKVSGQWMADVAVLNAKQFAKLTQLKTA